MKERVASRQNSRIKLAVSLKRTPNCRKTGKFLLEGPRFIGDLISSGERAEFLVMSEEATALCERTADEASAKGLPVLLVSQELFKEVSATEHSQGIAAVCRIPVSSTGTVFSGGTVLALDGVGDPGNAGTAVRSAAAFDCSGVLFLKGSAFPWSPKVTRASAGLNTRVPVMEADSLSDIRTAHPGYRFLEASAEGNDISSLVHDSPVCIVIGSEAQGVRKETRRWLDGSVSIPMSPGVESLNAGVSASILLYSLFRKRL